jgi:hypothetical protein
MEKSLEAEKTAYSLSWKSIDWKFCMGGSDFQTNLLRNLCFYQSMHSVLKIIHFIQKFHFPAITKTYSRCPPENNFLYMALEPFDGSWSLFRVLNFYTVGSRTPWTGISPSQGRYLHTGRKKYMVTLVHEPSILQQKFPFGMWCLCNLEDYTNISEESPASFFRVEEWGHI